MYLKSRYSGYESRACRFWSVTEKTRTISPDLGTASGRNHMASMRPKMAEFAPIPKASERAATNVKAGREARTRNAKWKSRNMPKSEQSRCQVPCWQACSCGQRYVR